MVQTREIFAKIKAIGETKKITKAMQMVAASKMKMAEQRMASARPYYQRLLEVINHVAESEDTGSHPFLKAVVSDADAGYIVVSSDRGLCGGLNINLFKTFIEHVSADTQEGHFFAAAIGTKAVDFLKRIDSSIISVVKSIGDKPMVADFSGLISAMIESYMTGKISSLYVCYNKFVNNIEYKPTIVQILPIKPAEIPVSKHSWDYLYEPSPGPLLNMLMQRYVDAMVYQAVLENIASEQSARMIAMKNATDNAAELIEEFKLIYNKARQASITQELMEIISGANAV